MSAVVHAVLRMSLVGSLTILAVLLLRVVLGRAPKIFSYALWLVVLFRLLCPVAFESDFSLLGLARSAVEGVSPRQEGSQMQDGMGENSALAENRAEPAPGRTGVENPVPSDFSIEEADTASPEKTQGTVETVLFVIWLVGIFVLCVYTFASDLRLGRYLKGAEHERDNVYVREGIDTPFVRGAFAPKIYLPAGLEEREREYLLLHEKTHIRRLDPLFRRLAFAALAVHWFNPLVWCAFFLSGRDMEMSCDEAVVRRLGDGVKQDYSNSLLSMSAGAKQGVLPLAFGEGDAAKRIKNILRYHGVKTGAALGCVCVLLVALVVLATNPKESGVAVETNTETEEVLASAAGEAATDGVMFQSILDVYSVSRSARMIDRIRQVREIDYVIAEAGGGFGSESQTGWEGQDVVGGNGDAAAQVLGDSPAFAEDCEFYINYNSEQMNPQPVDFDQFADCFDGIGEAVSLPCQVGYDSDGQIHGIVLMDYRYAEGLLFAPGCEGDSWDEMVELYGEDFLGEYYTLQNTVQADVADMEGTETIEVYAANDKLPQRGGLVLFKTQDGELLYTLYTREHLAEQNIYLGKMDGGGTGYVMKVQLENRDTYGEYDYHLYRFDEEGKIYQLRGSSFMWGGEWDFADGEGLEIWSHYLEHYLADSVLLLGTDYSGSRTDMESDSGRYTYETLFPDMAGGE